MYTESKVNFTCGNKLGGAFLKNKVEEMRKNCNEKQEDLARTVGVSRQTIISIEKGKYNPSILLAFKIANHFGKSIEEVFIFEEE